MESDTRKAETSIVDDDTPFDKILRSLPKQEINIDLSKFDGVPMSKEELLGLDRIQNILKRAEKEIDRIAAKASARKSRESATITLNKSDEREYIRSLVYAKLYGIKTPQHEQRQSAHKCRREKIKRSHESTKYDRFTPKTIDVKTNEVKRNNVHCNCNHSPNRWSKNTHLVEVVSKDRYEECYSKTKNLVIQSVPNVNIRSGLTKQIIPSLNIDPENEQQKEASTPNNVVLLETKFEAKPKPQPKETDIPESNTENKPETKIAFPSQTMISCMQTKTQPNPTTLLKNPDRVDFLCDFKHSVNEDNATAYATKSASRGYSFLQKHSQYKNTHSRQTTISNRNNKIMDKSKPQVGSFNPVSKLSTAKSSSIDYIPYSQMTIGGMRANEIINKYNMTKNNPIITPAVPAVANQTEEEIDNRISLNIQENQSHIRTSSEYEEDFEKNSSDLTEEDSNTSPKTVISDKHNESSADIFNESPPQLLSTSQSEPDEKIIPTAENELTTPNLSLTTNNKRFLKMKSKTDVFEYVHHIDVKDSSNQTRTELSVDMKQTQTSPTCEITEFPQNSSTISSLRLEEILKLRNDIQNILAANENLKQIDFSGPPLEDKFIQTSPIKTNSKDKQLSPIFSNRITHAETMTEALLDSETSDMKHNSPKARKPILKNAKVIPLDESTRNNSSGFLTDISQSETSDARSIGEINIKLLHKKNITLRTKFNKYSNRLTFDSSTASEIHSTSKSRSEGELNAL